LSIERAQKSLVKDIRALVTGSKTDKVRTGTSACDVHVAKRRAEVSLAIFTSTIYCFVSAIQFFVSHSIFGPAIQFLCQPFVSHEFLCHPFYLCQPLCVTGIFVSAILPVPTTFCVSVILLF
jgi:hypothetical protein